MNKLKQFLLKNFYVMVLITLGLTFLTNCETKKEEPYNENMSVNKEGPNNGNTSIECYNKTKAVYYGSAKLLPLMINKEYFYIAEEEYEYDKFGNQTKLTNYDAKRSNDGVPLDTKDLDSKKVTIYLYDANPVRYTKEDKKAKDFECVPKIGNLMNSDEYDKNNNLIITPENKFNYTYNNKGDKLTTLVYNSNSTILLSSDIYTYTYNSNNDWLTKTDLYTSVDLTRNYTWINVYDSRGLVTTEIKSTKLCIGCGWSESTTYNTYNEAGDIIWKSTNNISGSNDVTYYTYWPNGRLNVEWKTTSSSQNGLISNSYIRNEYDNYGNRTLESQYYKCLCDLKYKNEYDANGNLTSKTAFKKDDKWYSKTGYENFNNKGKPGKEISYDEDGSILFYILYEYTKR